MPKTRIDLLLVERGLAESRAQAQALIMAGQVRVNGEMALKAGSTLDPEARLEVLSGPRFVSRGGEKLEAALVGFRIDVKGFVCADVGASTGGFTDCLLQHGAVRVYALDVGKGILHWKLRNDPRVVVMEGTNARFIQGLPEPISLATIDASFISVRVLLPTVRQWLMPGIGSGAGSLVVLIKPQFEAGKREVARGRGVVRDSHVHRQVLLDVLTFAGSVGLEVRGLRRSPLLGPKGNAEFLAWLTPGAQTAGVLQALIDDALASPAGSQK